MDVETVSNIYIVAISIIKISFTGQEHNHSCDNQFVSTFHIITMVQLIF